VRSEDTLDKWFKRIWLVNGILVLAFITLSVAIQARDYLFPRKRIQHGAIVGPAIQREQSDSLVLQDLSLTVPQPIGNSGYSFIALVACGLTHPVRQTVYLSGTEGVLPDQRESNSLPGDTRENLEAR